jgi:hypothetical protein
MTSAIRSSLLLQQFGSTWLTLDAPRSVRLFVLLAPPIALVRVVIDDGQGRKLVIFGRDRQTDGRTCPLGI